MSEESTEPSGLVPETERIAELERDVQRLRKQMKGLAAFAVVVAFLLLPMSFLRNTASFRGEGGSLAIETSDRGPGIEMRDAQGRRRLLLGLSSDGTPVLSFHDSAEESRLTASVGDKGPSMYLMDSEGHPLVSIAALHDVGSLFVLDAGGKLTWTSLADK